MAKETFQIKQEPLDDIIYAAEMADIVADDAATIISNCGVSVGGDSMNSSKSNIKGTVYGTDRGACNRTNDIGGDVSTARATEFSNNVKIKMEPGIYAFAGQTLSNSRRDGICGDFRSQELFVEVKSEPVDSDFPTSNGIELLRQFQTNSTNTNHIKQCQQVSSNDFEVVDEHENIITISAAELSPKNRVLELKQKLQIFNELNLPQYNSQPRRIRKNFICKLCTKRCGQDAHFAHHMEQHRRNRMFCARKMCDTWFSSLEDCERHEYEAHEILQLKCNVCNHKFLGFEQLSQHKVKMHSKLHRFVCSLCRDWFISLVELQEHWRYLPDRCGRLANIDSLEKTYKLKSAPTIPNATGLKLKLLPANHISNQVPLISAIPNNSIEIKQEPMESESILPDNLPSTNSSNAKLPLKHELVAGTSSNNATLPILKLRLRKQPLSPKLAEDDRSSSPPAMQVNPNPLGHLLARRITSRFSLKTVPKMFHLTNIAKGNEQEEQPQPEQTPQQHQPPQAQPILNSQPLQQPPQPQPILTSQPLQQPLPPQTPQAQPAPTSQTLQSLMPLPTLKQSNINDNASNEPPQKMLKLSSNFRIVKLKSPPPQEILTSNEIPCPTTTTSTPTANAETTVPPFMRQFILKNVVVPPLDKTVAIAKLESVTKTNKEISLTELLDEAIVREKNENAAACNNNENTFYKIKLVKSATEIEKLEQQTKADIKTDSQIKTEFIEDVMVLQNEDSLSAANFSDSSISSSSNGNASHAVLAKDNGELPQRSRSLPAANSNKEKSVVKSNIGDGYICPKCGRRYSTFSTVSEHLNSNCGRNLRHECDVCHKCFFSTSTLNCHRTIHTGELPHKCNFCDKRFRTRGQVTVHHRTHTGERPFVCEICSQSFTHRETLISHLSRHIGMKRYKCYGCNKHFSCISGLSMHRATRPDTCGKFELNTRAVGPRVRVIRGRVVFEPQPTDTDDADTDAEVIGLSVDKEAQPTTVEVLAEIQNK